MISFAIILFAAFVLMSAGQLLLAWIYTRRFRSYRLPEVPDAALPKAAVILCLRGEDPFWRTVSNGLPARTILGSRFGSCWTARTILHAGVSNGGSQSTMSCRSPWSS